MMDMSQLGCALITGAARGIGRAIALELGHLGYRIAGTATTEEGAKALTRMLKDEGVSGQGFVLDISCDDSVESAFQEICGAISAPTVLVNNAGITQDNIIFRMKQAQWDDVINTNLNGTFRVTKACLKHMLKQRQGRIVNITSVVGASGSPGQANYCASKAGIIGFTKSLSQELATLGITVNAIAPGFIHTDMTAVLNDEQKNKILSQIPMSEMGQCEDIANAVAFMVSGKSRYITGQTLHVNGGMYLGG